MTTKPDAPVICLSHLRWHFVHQRPQHLLTCCGRDREVFFVEEPVYDGVVSWLEITRTAPGVTVVVPHLPDGMTRAQIEVAQRETLDRLVATLDGERPVLWYYTPMALSFSRHVNAVAVVYDCMDELSLFKGAPPELGEREAQLFALADVVFTGGHSLYRHKRATSAHSNIHPFPSSVDVSHFGQAREALPEPADQVEIPHPRVGFCGVIDERMDLALLDDLAAARPDLQLVMIGPVIKIDVESLPRRPNIHWLGGKSYDALPAYLAGWDVAMLPFARNDATRFISPTKTPEYLAAGKPVVSTSITDVVDPYGRAGLAWIADTARDMAEAIDEALASDETARRAHADGMLAEMSWDKTWAAMWQLVARAVRSRAVRHRPSAEAVLDSASMLSASSPASAARLG